MAGASAAKLTPVDNDVVGLLLYPRLFGGSDRSSVVHVVRHSKVTWQQLCKYSKDTITIIIKSVPFFLILNHSSIVSQAFASHRIK